MLIIIIIFISSITEEHYDYILATCQQVKTVQILSAVFIFFVNISCIQLHVHDLRILILGYEHLRGGQGH
jgi:hypothetical protein